MSSIGSREQAEEQLRRHGPGTRTSHRVASGPSREFFVFQAEDGIRDYKVTGVQTCALPIFKALEYALVKGKRIFLSAQHDATRDNPGPDEIHTLGTICNIVQSLKLPDGNVKVLVEGLDRGRALEFKEHEGFFKVVCKLIPKQTEAVSGVEALMSKVIALFEQYVKLSNNLHYDAMLAAVRVQDPGNHAHHIAYPLV